MMLPISNISTKCRRWYADPSAQVFAAMTIGVALGFAAPGVAEQMKPLGGLNDDFDNGRALHTYRSYFGDPAMQRI